MRSSYDSNIPSQQYINPRSKCRDKSFDFLSCIKSLLWHPQSGSRLPHRPSNCNERAPEQTVFHAVEEENKTYPSGPKTGLAPRVSPRGRRHQVPVASTADYLTLAQLENLWTQQDIHRRDTEMARISRDQMHGWPVTQSGGQRSVQWNNIHPALRPRHVCSHEFSDGLTACCHNPEAWISGSDNGR